MKVVSVVDRGMYEDSERAARRASHMMAKKQNKAFTVLPFTQYAQILESSCLHRVALHFPVVFSREPLLTFKNRPTSGTRELTRIQQCYLVKLDYHEKI